MKEKYSEIIISPRQMKELNIFLENGTRVFDPSRSGPISLVHLLYLRQGIRERTIRFRAKKDTSTNPANPIYKYSASGVKLWTPRR